MSKDGEGDIEQLKVTTIVQVSAAAHAIAAMFVGLSGLYLVNLGRFETWEIAMQWSLVALAAIQLGCAAMILRNRFWAAVAGVLTSLLTALGAAFYVMWLLSYATATGLSLVAVPLAIIAALLSPLTLVPTHRASAARRRLEAAGIELGV